jgi:hypothetical protein
MFKLIQSGPEGSLISLIIKRSIKGAGKPPFCFSFGFILNLINE